MIEQQDGGIRHQVLADRGLTPGAKGIWCVIEAFGPFRGIHQMLAYLNCGPEQARRYLGELKQHGFVQYEKKRLSNGRWDCSIALAQDGWHQKEVNGSVSMK